MLTEVTESQVAVARDVIDGFTARNGNTDPDWSRKLARAVLTEVAQAAADEPLSPADVAEMFRVDPKTVGRWAKEGWITPKFRTRGGQARYSSADVRNLMAGTDTKPPAESAAP